MSIVKKYVYLFPWKNVMLLLWTQTNMFLWRVRLVTDMFHKKNCVAGCGLFDVYLMPKKSNSCFFYTEISMNTKLDLKIDQKEHFLCINIIEKVKLT